MARKKDEELARYRDREGRAHRVVVRGRLALDLCCGEPTRVVCELSEAEGSEQVRAALFGSAIDEGYLARAAREPEPFCRQLHPADLRSGQLDPAEEDGEERRAA
jgi:hypothetical protein